MADRAVQHEELVIDAPAADCLAVALEVEQYSQWAADIREVDVLTRDGHGWPELVAFRVAAMGHSSSYMLRYDYDGLPARLAWVLEKGDVTTKLDGHYLFEPVADDPMKTSVHYELEVELVVPLPAIVKRRAEMKIMHTALRDLKSRVESKRSAGET